MSKKKVLFLTSWYPSRENSTLGNFVVKHAECSNLVADVTVLYAISSNEVSGIEFDDQIENGVRVLRVYYPKTTNKIPLVGSYKKVKRYTEALRKGFQYLNEKFDLVHLNIAFPAGLFAIELKEKHNLPYILLEHWTGYLSHTGTYRKEPVYIRKIHEKVFKNAEHVLVVSEHLGQSLKKLNLIDNYIVYSNVVDKDLFYPAENKSHSNELRIIHVSSFDDEHKNISGMLSSIANLNVPYRLNLITESSVSIVKKHLSKAKINLDIVDIRSNISAKEVGEVMRASDVLVLFSNYETFSVVIAEAWMSGIPTIYSRCGGLTEIDNSTLGVQVKKGDQSMLAKSLEKFERKNYSVKKITEYAQQFEKTRLSDKIKNIYDEIC